MRSPRSSTTSTRLWEPWPQRWKSRSAATREIATNIAQASQGIQEVNENVNQSSTVAAEITKDIAVVNQSSGEIANSSDQVKVSAEDLKRMGRRTQHTHRG